MYIGCVCVCVYIYTYTTTTCFAAFWAWLSIGKRPINLGTLEESSHSPLWCRDAVSSLFRYVYYEPSSLSLVVAIKEKNVRARRNVRKWEETREGNVAACKLWACCKCTRSCTTMIVHKRVQLCPVLIWESAGGSSSWGLDCYREISVRLNYRPQPRCLHRPAGIDSCSPLHVQAF